MTTTHVQHRSLVDFVVLSNIIIDDVVLANGQERFGQLGGAATYAAAGLRLWASRVGLVAGVGEDFTGFPRSWFESNGIDLKGVTERDAFTPRSWVRYEVDGERNETPQHGADHFRLMQPVGDQIPSGYCGARGAYIFRSNDRAFWDSMRAMRAAVAQTMLWEISADAAHPDQRAAAAGILKFVTILSMNRSEAFRLYRVSRPIDALHAALEDGARVVALRLGSDGSMVTDGQRLLEVSAVPIRAVDVTGGGNAYSGGFLAGYCGAASSVFADPLAAAARCGAASAACVIAQYGPPAHIDHDMIREAVRRAAALQIVTGTLR